MLPSLVKISKWTIWSTGLCTTTCHRSAAFHCFDSTLKSFKCWSFREQMFNLSLDGRRAFVMCWGCRGSPRSGRRWLVEGAKKWFFRTGSRFLPGKSMITSRKTCISTCTIIISNYLVFCFYWSHWFVGFFYVLTLTPPGGSNANSAQIKQLFTAC